MKEKKYMLTRNEIINFLSKNRNMFKEKYHVIKIGLFGSFARDEQNEKSDIDILIEFEKGMQDIFELKLELKEYLEKQFGRQVELCREKYLKPYAKEIIIKDIHYA